MGILYECPEEDADYTTIIAYFFSWLVYIIA